MVGPEQTDFHPLRSVQLHSAITDYTPNQHGDCNHNGTLSMKTAIEKATMALSKDVGSEDSLNRSRTSALNGHCQCGAIILTSTQLPVSITICHCVQCQKMSGAPFIAWGSFENSVLQWMDQAYENSRNPNQKGALRIRASDIMFGETPLAHRGSCGKCGSPLFMKYSCTPDHTDVALGIIDSETVKGDMVKPGKHIFLQEKAKWWDFVEDEVKKCDYFDDDFMKVRSEWVQGGAKMRGDVGNDDKEEEV